jgi:hypothetical protein
MRRLSLLPILALLLAGCAAQPTKTAPPAAVPPLQPNMARVWMLRQVNTVNPNALGDPIVYINGASLGHVMQGTAFYHDVPPGTYRFTVQPYGTPANRVDTLQLVPGMTAYLQVQWVANWLTGSTVGGASFAVLTMTPRDAQALMPGMTLLGQR